MVTNIQKKSSYYDPESMLFNDISDLNKTYKDFNFIGVYDESPDFYRNLQNMISRNNNGMFLEFSLTKAY